MALSRFRAAGVLVAILVPACGPSAGGAEETSAEGGSESSAEGGSETSADSGPLPGSCEGAVNIPDAALATAVRTELGLGGDDAIEGAQLAAVTSLQASELGIVDLTGLECATSLDLLFVQNNAIEDLSPIADLPVAQLFLQRNRIVDVSPLREMPVLYNLHLDGNLIEDLSPLSGHSVLMTLGAADNQIASTAGLADLPALANLDLEGNPLAIVEGLDGMPQVFSLRLGRTGVADLSVIAKFPALDNAHFQQTAVADLSSLPGHASLTWLELGDAQVAGAQVEATLPGLVLLDLSGNQLQSIAGLDPADVPALATLLLDRNPLTDLSSLAAFEALTGGLSIADVGTGASDLSPIAAMTLGSLSAPGNDIADLAPVAGVVALDLSRNAITDLQPLGGMTGVTALNLADNLVTDVSALTDVVFETCATVSLEGNPLDASADAVLDDLCAQDVTVTGHCLPDACNPCPPDAEDCG